MPVELKITVSDIGLIVRFLRQFWSALQRRHYMATELIIVVAPEYESDMLADFEIFRDMDDTEQRKFIDVLRSTRYTGRQLGLQHSLAPVAESQPESESEMFLF